MGQVAQESRVRFWWCSVLKVTRCLDLKLSREGTCQRLVSMSGNGSIRLGRE